MDVVKATKELPALTPENLRSDGDGLTTCHAVVFLIAKSFWKNDHAGVSEEFLRNSCYPFEDKA
jgi:hypothetical protein